MGDLEKLGSIIANSALGRRIAALQAEGLQPRDSDELANLAAARMRERCTLGKCRYRNVDCEKPRRETHPAQCEGWWGRRDAAGVMRYRHCPRHEAWIERRRQRRGTTPAARAGRGWSEET